ncbi:MAG: hypothetical protein M0Z52_13560 [Actinomycetota bacterium]|nr:hypothetical protein [Actinomycetota bacterium]
MKPGTKKALPYLIFVPVILALAGLLVYSYLPRHTVQSCGMRCCCSPFGGYCKGAGRGWYGADKSVESADDASKVIRQIYLPRKVSVTNIRDEAGFFEADVKDSNNKKLDTVIVDKRTGRIRSIY